MAIVGRFRGLSFLHLQLQDCYSPNFGAWVQHRDWGLRGAGGAVPLARGAARARGLCQLCLDTGKGVSSTEELGAKGIASSL